MSSPLPPEPYEALGISKDAAPAVVKITYRKLALKLHPDKVSTQDELRKTHASEQFHRVQQAYEILGDEDRRARYDALVRLAELRREVMERQGALGPDVQSYASGPQRVSEERRPTYDPDYFNAASRVN